MHTTARLPALALLLALAPAGVADTDWPLHGNDHGNRRYSGLDQIHRGNVAGLELAWSYRTGKRATFQATPIVHDGVMYLTTPFNDLIALDAASGAERWRYRHALRSESFCCGPANRGAAVAGGKVYMATIDARLIALDAADGRVIWDLSITATEAGQAESVAALAGVPELAGAVTTGHSGYTANMAPQIHAGLVYVGISGAGYGLHLEQDQDGRPVLSVGGLAGGGHGLRGFLVAYDADTGAEVWRWYTVPERGWEGRWRGETAYGVPLNRDLDAERAAFEHYPDSWRMGGGSVFTTPAIDAELGLLYLGTGNPSPQMDDSTRPGDNLYTVSLVALEAATGRLVWHYQQVPHDRWGYDVASPPVLLDVQRDGETVPAVVQASKLGWLFVHDRRSGELLHLSEPFVPQENLFAVPDEQGVRITPGTLGAVSWSPVAFDPGRRSVFVPGIHQPAWFYSRRLEPQAGRPWRSYSFFQQADEPDWGLLSAIDVDSGRLRWQQRLDRPLVGGVLATAGGLVFTGEGDGWLAAFDADSGERLWRHPSEAGVNAPPITYSLGGRQYIAVAAGGNSLFGYTVGDELLVFALPPPATRGTP